MSPVLAPPRREDTSHGAPPPSAGLREEGGDSGWAQLTRARDDIDAHLLTGRLEVAGIETRTVKDRTQPGTWLYGGSNPWAPVAVLVRRWQLEEARSVLLDIAAERLPDDEAPGDTLSPRKLALVWWVTALALGVSLTAIALSQSIRAATVCHIPALCDEPFVDR